MLIINFLRYIVGVVKFKSFGGFSERFLNLCEKENIPLWNIKNKNGEITAFTSANGYKHLRHISKSSGMKTKIIKKKGLRFFLTKNKVRSGLCIGAVVCTLIVATLSQFVWRIEVVGNVNIEEDEILSAFSDCGVKIGAKMDSLELKNITAEALKEMPSLSWASVNKKGSVLCIEVREKREVPKMYDDSVPTNVVASEDGLIVSSDVLQGTEEVKIGSAVRKGDLLISGVIKLRDGGEELLHADGFVRAKTKENYKISTKKLDLLKLEEMKKRKDIFFFGFIIPIGASVSGDILDESASFLQSGDICLPIGVISETGLSFSENGEFPNDYLELVCAFKCAEHIKNLTDTAEVKSTSISTRKIGQNKLYEVNLECEKDIATLQEIYIEKTNDIA